jgi:hypothetical protein
MTTTVKTDEPMNAATALAPVLTIVETAMRSTTTVRVIGALR